MEKLILLTAAYRLNNLKYIAASIINNIPKEYFGYIHWLIIIDKAHATGDIQVALDMLKENNISYSVVYSLAGIGKEAVYGGDVYNEPLGDLLNKEFEYEDPWIYVLDDDNIIHPFLFDFFLKGSESGKRILWMTMQSKTGKVHEANVGSKLLSYSIGQVGYHLDLTKSDPSQLIIRSSLIRNWGGYGSGPTYDYDWLVYKVKEFEDEIYYFHDYQGYGRDQSQAYWNGLVTNEQLNDYCCEVASGDPIASHLYYETKYKKCPQIIPLDMEEVNIIMKFLKSHRNGKIKP